MGISSPLHVSYIIWTRFVSCRIIGVNNASEYKVDIDDGEGKLSPPSRPDEYNFQSLGGGNENNKTPGQKRRKFTTWLSSCSVC